MTLFNDPVAIEFRDLAAAAFAGRDPRDSDEILTGLIEAECLSLELSTDLNGMGLGLTPSVEIFAAIGLTGADVTAAERAFASLDALGEHGDDEALEWSERVLAGSTELIQVSNGWQLQECGNSFALSVGPQWSSRRAIRRASYLIGLADCCYQEMVSHTHRRQIAGAGLFSKQLVADKVVRILAEIRLASSACREAALAADAGAENRVAAALRAHRLAIFAAQKASRSLVQLRGARGMTAHSTSGQLYKLSHQHSGTEDLGCSFSEPRLEQQPLPLAVADSGIQH
ncbi:acyl-CoA dehydrogenase family protein [Psychromicrobium lacuslunae]|uniref:Acyl-CoA dehydrogenase/oxidase C-terminal domain-containing protein n=1 Tax=Psychromicrobium lacuslunae TaxID=1618207 RepID=A0A0D4C2E1_9MICC|nr:hypothetical protein UM93_15300 [Psychromicrobium lacuslunae]